MSNSLVNEKYRKYAELLRRDPMNSMYARKLNKYRTMAINLTQRGGNAGIVEPDNVSSAAGTETNDLVNKINAMLAYAKGGARQSTGTRRVETKKVKGYRDMSGGAWAPPTTGDASDALKKVEDINTIASIKSQQELGVKIEDGVNKLRTDNEELKKRIAELTAKIADLEEQLAGKQTEQGKIQQRIEELDSEKGALMTAYHELVNELNKKPLDLGIDTNPEFTAVQIKQIKEKVTDKLNALNEELAALKAKSADNQSEIDALNTQLEEARSDLKAAEAYYTGEIVGLAERIKAYDAQLTEFQTKYGNLFE